MRKMMFLGIVVVILMGLTACGESKYNDAIDTVIAQDKQSMSSNNMADIAKELDRDTADIKVLDDGKYIYLTFGKNNYESIYKKMSDGSYKEASSEQETYAKEDAKLDYEENNGEVITH
ncbi:hypothetical protein [Listeria rustica]|uniref:DUF4467 domain-containing protein n=1 Tax=Listeria rustica TaxID=2713503 RepID=A0A7W1T530_9LIST|nr:hypothetical protein [Listeria rustica]MBA3925574.1 hypothetical protein [Listeria rustica]